MATLNFDTNVADWTTNSGSATVVPNSIPKTQFQSMLTGLVPTNEFFNRKIGIAGAPTDDTGYAVTTLVNSVTAGSTTIDLTDASGFPSSGYAVLGTGANRDSLRWTGKSNNQLTGVTAITYSHSAGTQIEYKFSYEFTVHGNSLFTSDGLGTEVVVRDTSSNGSAFVSLEAYSASIGCDADGGNAMLILRDVSTTTNNYFRILNDGATTEFRLLDYDDSDKTASNTRWPIKIDNATGHVGIGGDPDTGTTSTSYELIVRGQAQIFNNGSASVGTQGGGTELYVRSDIYASTTLAQNYTHGTDTTITLTDASGFNNEGYGSIGNDVFYWQSKSGNVLTLATVNSVQNGGFNGSKTAGVDVQAGGGTTTLNVSSQNTDYGYGQIYAEGGGGARLDLVDTGITQSTNERTTLSNIGGATYLDIYDSNDDKKFDGFQLDQTTGNWSFGDRSNFTVTQTDLGVTTHNKKRPSLGVGRSSRPAFRGPSATATQSLNCSISVSSGTATVTFTDVATDIQPFDRVHISSTGSATMPDGYETVLTTTPSGIGINAFTYSTSAPDQTISSAHCSKELHTPDLHIGMVGPSTKINMSGGLSSSATTVDVDLASRFPEQGCIKIGDEQISYSGRTATSFTGLTRGIQGTTAAAHNDNATVETTQLDKDRHYGWMWVQQGISLGGYTQMGAATGCSDTDSPYSDLMKGVTTAHTRLSSAIGTTETTIDVDSTTGFGSSGTIIINSETITYTGTTATSFTGCTRGASTSGYVTSHGVDALVIKSISTSMGFLDATSQGHFVAAIRGNDAGDGFHIVGSEVNTATDWDSDLEDGAGVRYNWESTPFSILKATHRGVTINEHSQNMDFRVESEDNEYMLHMAATHNAVGIGGEADSNYELTVTGDVKISGAGVSLPNLPTSSSGLSAGTLWNDSGTLKIA